MPKKSSDTAQLLLKLAEDLTTLAKSLSDVPAETATEEKPAKVEKKKVVTLEEVRSVLAEKSRAGFTAAVRAIIEKYGAERLSEIDPANFEAVLKDAEVIGNG